MDMIWIGERILHSICIPYPTRNGSRAKNVSVKLAYCKVDMFDFVILSQTTYSGPRPHRESIWYQNYDKVGTEFQLGQNQQCHDTCP